MGNSNNNQKQSNVIHIEFMTAKQKVHKDTIVNSKSQQLVEYQQQEEAEIIQNYQQYYKVDFRKTLYISQSKIEYKQIMDLITKPDIKTSTDLLSICAYYTTNVKSFEIYFNGKSFTKDDQGFDFGYEPLQVEVIYQPKHWLQRVAGNIKVIGQKVSRVLQLISKMAYIAIPLYSSVATLSPLLLPTLGTAQLALKKINNPKAQSAQSFIKTIIRVINKTLIISQPVFRLISRYLPGSKKYAAVVGLYLGRGVFLQSIKLAVTLFFPFLSPFLMLIN